MIDELKLQLNICFSKW